MSRILIILIVVTVVCIDSARGEGAGAPADSVTMPEITGAGRFGHEFALPIGSLFIPGLGQWGNGDANAGLAFFGAAVLGLAVAVANYDADVSSDRLPRDRDAQALELGFLLSGAAGALSGYDGFRRSLPKLKAGGHYEFLDKTTPTSATFVAPLKFGFLKNRRTWLALTIPLALVAALAIDQAGEDTLPFHVHDAVYAGGVSYGAGITEEAFFRGYLFPVFNELWGERVWLANSTQALLFGLAHLPSVSVPIAQTLAGFYWGWIVQKSDWDFQETIFQHFWWDAILLTGVLLLDDGGGTKVSISLPTIRF